MTPRPRAFTLIELLIVVGIVAILAGLAMENYLQAKIRANVARVRSDFRTVETAIEAYHVDHGTYARMADSVFYGDPAFDHIDGVPVRGVLCKSLSTPIAYVTSFMMYDPFMTGRPDAALDERVYSYHVLGEYVAREPSSTFWPAAAAFYGEWRTMSVGPDQTFGHGFSNSAQLPYDPTNGLVSFGNITVSHSKTEAFPPAELLGAH